MKHLHGLWGVALGAALWVFMTIPVQANLTILAQNLAQTNGGYFYVGQSFTTPDDGMADYLKTITLFSGEPVLESDIRSIHVFDYAFAGTPNELLNGTAVGNLGNAQYDFDTGQYDFSSQNAVLDPNTQYWFFTDGIVTTRFAQFEAYTGGDEYMAFDEDSGYIDYGPWDLQFSVSGTALVPEPSRIALVLGLLVSLVTVARRYCDRR